MNLRNVAFVVIAVVGLTATMAAQRATPGGRKAPAKARAKTVTITGCVAQGIDADHYVLANAVKADKLEALLVREKRLDLAKACFDFLPARAKLDLAGWDGDIFSHE